MRVVSVLIYVVSENSCNNVLFLVIEQNQRWNTCIRLRRILRRILELFYCSLQWKQTWIQHVHAQLRDSTMNKINIAWYTHLPLHAEVCKRLFRNCYCIIQDSLRPNNITYFSVQIVKTKRVIEQFERLTSSPRNKSLYFPCSPRVGVWEVCANKCRFWKVECELVLNCSVSSLLIFH